jgi:hypothetical protein
MELRQLLTQAVAVVVAAAVVPLVVQAVQV